MLYKICINFSHRFLVAAVPSIKFFKVIIYNIRMGSALETRNNTASFRSQGFGNIHGAFKRTMYISPVTAMI